MPHYNTVQFSHHSTTIQDKMLEEAVSFSQQEAVINLLDERVQAAYDRGYEGKDFIESSALPPGCIARIAEEEHQIVLDLLNEVEASAFDAGVEARADDGDDEEEEEEEEEDE